MDVNEHERLSYLSLRHKLKEQLYYYCDTLTVGSSIMSMTRTLI
jgi:hypothetical protein